jgi:hypothetical protein
MVMSGVGDLKLRMGGTASRIVDQVAGTIFCRDFPRMNAMGGAHRASHGSEASGPKVKGMRKVQSTSGIPARSMDTPVKADRRKRKSARKVHSK